MEPLLICELGLHGDGDPAYYTRIVDEIAKSWTGWPPLAVKTQLWNPKGEWARKVTEEMGRPPLAAMTVYGLRFMKAYCRDRGLLFGCTAHDPQSAGVLSTAETDFIKLGSRANLDTGEAAFRSGLPVISSGQRFAGAERWMECVSAYPANAPWMETLPGYSCHCVPGLAQKFVLQAAPHCWTIEVHVSARPLSVRPLPADMCVSLRVPEFLELATEVGKVWKA